MIGRTAGQQLSVSRERQAVHRFGMTPQNPDHPSRVGFPYPDAAIVATARHRRAVRMVCHSPYGISMPAKHPNFSTAALPMGTALNTANRGSPDRGYTMRDGNSGQRRIRTRRHVSHCGSPLKLVRTCNRSKPPCIVILDSKFQSLQVINTGTTDGKSREISREKPCAVKPHAT